MARSRKQQHVLTGEVAQMATLWPRNSALVMDSAVRQCIPDSSRNPWSRV
jgi:hypothetical protein